MLYRFFLSVLREILRLDIIVAWTCPRLFTMAGRATFAPRDAVTWCLAQVIPFASFKWHVGLTCITSLSPDYP